MSVTIKTKKKEIVFISRCYFEKKFQGLGILFDTDVTQGFLYKTVLLIKIKLFFFSFWMSVDYKNRVLKTVRPNPNFPVGGIIHDDASEIVLRREAFDKLINRKPK